MQLWRKALALILLVAFLPATVLAAMPVKLCLGGDGHRAIESAIGGEHHSDAFDVGEDVVAASSSIAPPDCIDLDVMVVASCVVRHSGDQSKSPSHDNTPPAVLMNGMPRLSQPTLGRPCVLTSADAGTADPFLIAHATDVLLN